MAYCARVSSSNQDNPDYEKLLKYCVEKGHWSVFEMADMTIEITTSRAIAQQITLTFALIKVHRKSIAISPFKFLKFLDWCFRIQLPL